MVPFWVAAAAAERVRGGTPLRGYPSHDLASVAESKLSHSRDPVGPSRSRVAGDYAARTLSALRLNAAFLQQVPQPWNIKALFARLPDLCMKVYAIRM